MERGMFMIQMEQQQDNCTIRIHDDYCVNSQNFDMKQLSHIVSKSYQRRLMQEKQNTQKVS